MKKLGYYRFFLWVFSHFQVPLIGVVKPRLIELTDRDILIRLPLARKTKNHLNSMYFGALAIGADLAGGFHAVYHAKQSQMKISLAFKSFQAQFLKRPESAVYFSCHQGLEVKQMLEQSKQTGERVNREVSVLAFTHANESEPVAQFSLELSVKVLS